MLSFEAHQRTHPTTTSPAFSPSHDRATCPTLPLASQRQHQQRPVLVLSCTRRRRRSCEPRPSRACATSGSTSSTRSTEQTGGQGSSQTSQRCLPSTHGKSTNRVYKVKRGGRGKSLSGRRPGRKLELTVRHSPSLSPADRAPLLRRDHAEPPKDIDEQVAKVKQIQREKPVSDQMKGQSDELVLARARPDQGAHPRPPGLPSAPSSRDLQQESSELLGAILRHPQGEVRT